MTDRVTVDTRQLTRAVRNLESGLSRSGPDAGARTAGTVADRLAAGLPVRSGRLRRSVRAVRTAAGGEVSYGQGVPYAGYIDGRTGAVDDAISGADDTFRAACETAAEQEARRL